MTHDQTVKAVTGTVVSGGATITSFLAAATPIVQFLAALVGLAVGIATLIFYIKKIRGK